MGNIQDTVDQLRPIDDTFKRKLAEERNVCQEMLQVIMDAKELRIISNKPQKDIHNIDTRSVTVDILCADENGRQFSVEVQKADDDGTALADYMRILKSPKVEADVKFLEICNAVKYYKEGKGREKMCKAVEAYAEEKVKEAEKEAEKKAMETTIMTAKSLICDGVADDVIHSATKLPLETIVALRKECNTN